MVPETPPPSDNHVGRGLRSNHLCSAHRSTHPRSTPDQRPFVCRGARGAECRCGDLELGRCTRMVRMGSWGGANRRRKLALRPGFDSYPRRRPRNAKQSRPDIGRLICVLGEQSMASQPPAIFHPAHYGGSIQSRYRILKPSALTAQRT